MVNSIVSKEEKFCYERMQNPLQTRENGSKKESDAILSFKQEDKENKQSWFSKNGAYIGFGLAGATAIAAFFMNRNMSRKLADVTTKLSQATNELNMTKAQLSEAQGVIKEAQQLASTPAKKPLMEIFERFMSNATKGLRLTNEFGSECGRFCENVGNIKRFIG